MSGHSKWSTIKHKKGATDAKRAKLFGRLSKEISVSVREGGHADPLMNPRLRLALQNARSANMPKENMEKAMRKGQDDEKTRYLEPVYEGYAAAGIAVYVECATENINRTVSQVRHLFQKHGGSLATKGALDFLFDRKGFFVVAVPNIEEEEETAFTLIDAGAEQLLAQDDQHSLLICPFDVFGALQKTIEKLGIPIVEASLQRVPHNLKALDPKDKPQVQKLLGVLEEAEDVQRIFHNMEE